MGSSDLFGELARCVLLVPRSADRRCRPGVACGSHGHTTVSDSILVLVHVRWIKWFSVETNTGWGRKVSAPPREDISSTRGADIDSESSPRLFMFGLMSNPSRSSVHESLLLRGVCTGKRPWYSYGGAEKRIEQTGERCMGTPHTVKIIHTVSQN